MCTFAALTIGGAVLSAAGSISQGNSARALAEAQAKAYEVQAENERRAAAFEINKQARAFTAQQGAAIAQVGASGVTLAGSPTEVLGANAAENQMDLEAIRYGSRLKQSQLRTQADISRMSGKAAQTAGFINAATGFVSGISQLYNPAKSIRFGSSPFAYGS